jgi:hypothetical protein
VRFLHGVGSLIVSLRPLCILNSRSTAAKYNAAVGPVVVAAMTCDDEFVSILVASTRRKY